MSAGVYNFTIQKNSDFSRIITRKDSQGNPIDITGATVTLIARVNKNDSTPVISLSAGNGLTLDGTNGKITVEIDDSDTAAYTFETANYSLKVNDDIILKGVVATEEDESV